MRDFEKSRDAISIGVLCDPQFVIVGPGEVEPEIQNFDSEDVNEPTTEKLPKVTEEKPERSKDSTIHTAHQFLMDASQVRYLMHRTTTETVCFH